ncbi:chemotaxis protein methyltransferase CheR [Silvibacterium bohemicum]|uniref:protein-glutamate O-methyltransferase n=1 Tax=Silvibacterium bohemicum TaxID=1577686 RepID=A0A841K606_9BACT|nr:protein-glutamate O-methyltransferase CheR [Silvibacterium bohemicum]MBB6146571.1 chemotaxis protein methyltransferase CheR [Silvibacterium bohemicum]
MIETSKAFAETKPAPPRSVITDDNYSFLQKHVYNASGIVLDASKLYLIESRLTPIVRIERLQSLNELCQQVRQNSSSLLARRVVEAMTTNETLFFRDLAIFDALRKTVIPRILQAKAAGRKLSIWSAAASTGQEAFSLGMMLNEMGIRPGEVEILATDLSEQVLERARKGRFLQIEVNRGLPSSYLLKYFRQNGLEWEIDASIRNMVSFRSMDLRQSMRGMGPFDIVLCRNVLIYFDVDTKKAILDQIRGALAPGGTLVLGCAETIINLHDGFATETIGGAIVYFSKNSSGI